MTARDPAGVFVPPPLLFLVPLVGATVLHQRVPWPMSVDDQWMLRVGAFLLLAAGTSLGIAGVMTFRRAHTTILPAGRPITAIVDRGPYRFTRNPMYVGDLGIADDVLRDQ